MRRVIAIASLSCLALVAACKHDEPANAALKEVGNESDEDEFADDIYPDGQVPDWVNIAYFQQDCVDEEFPCSFTQVWRVLSKKSEVISIPPARNGLGLSDIPGISADLLTENVDGVSPPAMLGERARRTHNDRFDIRPKSRKWFHPAGSCAPIEWVIDTSGTDWKSHTSGRKPTGLLANGRVNGIIRLSSGSKDTKKGQKRLFGFAIKLWPTQDPAEPVPTVNIFTLDSYSFGGSNRDSFFWENDGQSVTFSNVIKVEGPLKLAMKAFGYADSPANERPLYPFAMVNAKGSPVESPVSIYRMEFVPNFPKKDNSNVPEDFRTELADYREDIKFDIYMAACKQETVVSGETQCTGGFERYRLGYFKVVGKPLMTDACDLRLHFAHHPNKARVPGGEQASAAKEYSGTSIRTEADWL